MSGEARHEQNVRDLRLIRDDPGWALTAVQQWRQLGQEVDRLTAALKDAERERERQARYKEALVWIGEYSTDEKAAFEARMALQEPAQQGAETAAGEAVE